MDKIETIWLHKDEDKPKYEHVVYSQGFLICNSDVAPTDEEYLKMVDSWRNRGLAVKVEQS